MAVSSTFLALLASLDLPPVFAQAPQAPRSPFLRFVTEDWYFAIPLFLMSAVGITLVIWRLLLNFNYNTKLSEFLPKFQEKLDKEGVEGALRFCKMRKDIIPNKLFVAGLDTHKQGLAAMRRAMANVVELEILPDLNFLLPPMLALAKIATMVGLLGTVLSMIYVFSSANPAEQTDKIGLALYATALGLVCAIPLVFCHVLFRAWIAQFEIRMKGAAQKLLILVQARGAKGTAATPAVPTPAPATTPNTALKPAGPTSPAGR